MALAAGTKLGPYEILIPLGSGGMGEVYRARDTRLGREVAVKVATERFSERFDREARAVAALNHSHICSLYDVGPNYLVMEYVEGQSPKGPLPLEKAIEYAGQILDALDHAHRKGITQAPSLHLATDWSRDGRIAYVEVGKNTQEDIWTVALTPDGRRVLAQTQNCIFRRRSAN